MLGVTDYGAFVVAIIVFLLIPGPGNLALITSTGKGGIKGGLAATLGVIVGDQVLMWLAVAGVAALLSAYPAAFHAVQWLGAAYLAWLGGRIEPARSHRHGVHPRAARDPALGADQTVILGQTGHGRIAGARGGRGRGRGPRRRGQRD